MTFLFKNSLKLPLGKQLLKVFNQQSQLQSLKTTNVFFKPNKHSPSTTPQNDSSKDLKKHKEALKVTLFQNQNMTVIGLEAAKNLAKRRSLHLVKVQDMDPKTQRPVYKLLTEAEMLQNELSDIKKSVGNKNPANAAKKSEKSLSISSRIGEHDLSSRLKNISKWLNKQHEVRILIQATSEQDLANAEKIFKTIEETIKTPQVIGKILQKRTKGNVMKFSILPVTPEAKNDSTDNSQ